jgi:hypothetical protein
MLCLPQLPHLLLALQEPRLLSRIGGADCQCSDGFQYVQRAWDLPLPPQPQTSYKPVLAWSFSTRPPEISSAPERSFPDIADVRCELSRNLVAHTRAQFDVAEPAAQLAI